MLQENLKTLRKLKGMTQEEMADRLHVVRQTISKWEKGLSVPDADMLTRIAELFEVSVSDLLGDIISNAEDRNTVVEQLSRINEQLAIKNRRSKKIWQIVLAVVLALIIGTGIAILFLSVDSNNIDTAITESTEIIYP